MTNEELVHQIIISKNTDLFEILYDRFSKPIYNKCYSFVNNEDEAKDLTQDIFLKLFVKISSFKGNSKFSTWLYSFTYNHCVNYVTRNSKKKYETRLTESFDIENYAEEGVSKNELTENLDQRLDIALSQISEDDRLIIKLKYKDNLSIKNIEQVLGLGTSAVKMRIKRARQRLAVSYAA